LLEFRRVLGLSGHGERATGVVHPEVPLGADEVAVKVCPEFVPGAEPEENLLAGSILDDLRAYQVCGFDPEALAQGLHQFGESMGYRPESRRIRNRPVHRFVDLGVHRHNKMSLSHYCPSCEIS
jgi:hypothetical protein